ncbi:MAG: hypothetical protein JSR14_03245 [Proteobacteria bacterium]|nr:hypothetical protein [Pseudomonadota bacterium]
MLGAPIDLMFEVRPDPGKDLASSCLSARLVSGANTISDARVQVTPVLGGALPMVRVQTRMAADEPVLTVTLAAGCEGRVTRTYTFLADPPAVVATTGQRPAGGPGIGAAGAQRGAVDWGARDAVAPASAALRQRNVAALAPNAEGDDLLPAGGSTRPPTRVNTARAPRAPEPSVRPRALAPAPAAAPRLLVEPLDLWLDTPLTLRLTRDEPALLSAPDESRRAEFAALWKALSATPEDLQQAMAQLDKLQADATTQGKQVEAERAKVAELQQRLAQAEQERFSAHWIYALGGLLVLAVGGMAWALRRRQHDEQQAWQHSVARSESLKNGAVEAEGADGQPQWQEEPDAADTWQPSAQARADEAEEPMPEDAPDTVPVGPAAMATAPVALEPAVPQAARAQHILPPDALFDMQQQAEFFISIGEHEQALEVLRTHIDEHGDAMPWAYLESLRLFHMLGRTESFNRMRLQFEQRFNGQVPGFGQFQHSDHTLEDYPEALAQIEALWSSPDVMAVIDGFLFRRGDAPDAERFDLAAFDDLLLLLAIAQTTPAHLRGAPPPRARTTPRAERVTIPADRSLDSIAGDLSLMPSGYDVLTPQPEPKATLDVDLSQLRMPDIALGDDVQAGARSPQAHSTGLGQQRAPLELRFELDDQDKTRL